MGGAYSWETGVREILSGEIFETLLVEGELELLKGKSEVEDVGVGQGRRGDGLVDVLALTQLSWGGVGDGSGGHNGGEGDGVLHIEGWLAVDT